MFDLVLSNINIVIHCFFETFTVLITNFQKLKKMFAIAIICLLFLFLLKIVILFKNIISKKEIPIAICDVENKLTLINSKKIEALFNIKKIINNSTKTIKSTIAIFLNIFVQLLKLEIA